LAIEKYSAVRETSRGLGEAIGYYEKTLKLMESCKPIVMTIPSSYQESFNKKFQEVQTGL
jgi:hypothetical protein